MKGGVPQGTQIGVLPFLCMINDLQPPPSPPPIDTVKFVDDTTLQQIIKTTKKIQGPSFMQQAFDEVQTWTSDNSMGLNPPPPKTEEMLTSFTAINHSYSN